MLPNANPFTVSALYNNYYYYYYSSYFSKSVNASNVSLFSGSHKVSKISKKLYMPVCNTKRILHPYEQRFLSDVAFSVY